MTTLVYPGSSLAGGPIRDGRPPPNASSARNGGVELEVEGEGVACSRRLCQFAKGWLQTHRNPIDNRQRSRRLENPCRGFEVSSSAHWKVAAMRKHWLELSDTVAQPPLSRCRQIARELDVAQTVAGANLSTDTLTEKLRARLLERVQELHDEDVSELEDFLTASEVQASEILQLRAIWKDQASMSMNMLAEAAGVTRRNDVGHWKPQEQLVMECREVLLQRARALRSVAAKQTAAPQAGGFFPRPRSALAVLGSISQMESGLWSDSSWPRIRRIAAAETVPLPPRCDKVDALKAIAGARRQRAMMADWRPARQGDNDSVVRARERLYQIVETLPNKQHRTFLSEANLCTRPRA